MNDEPPPKHVQVITWIVWILFVVLCVIGGMK